MPSHNHYKFCAPRRPAAMEPSLAPPRIHKGREENNRNQPKRDYAHRALGNTPRAGCVFGMPLAPTPTITIEGGGPLTCPCLSSCSSVCHVPPCLSDL